ncbi:A24 family peptidase [Agrococcus sp. 1P02AA]|uniref:prepilin peptidase n=1 Tax=Agrococcus sp. 1P02AA TaxID=3132259 RepID=UPI0039A5119B
MTDRAAPTARGDDAPDSGLWGPVRPVRLRASDGLGIPLAVAVAVLLIARGLDAVAVVPLVAAAAAAPALARIDILERRLPNAITVPLLLLGAIACTARAAAGDLAMLAAVGVGAALLTMAVVGGMGMGDVKLGTALALASAPLGWAAPLLALAASVIVGGVAGLGALALGRRTIAFGPWLLVGHAVAVATLVAAR